MKARKYFSVESVKAHFSNIVSDSVVKYSTDKVFLSSRYMFIHREGKQQYGYCTHCKQSFKTDGLRRHNTQARCPMCQSKCTVKGANYGRSRMIDEVYFVYYEKSVFNPKAIVARGIYAVRDYRFDYRHVETQFKVKAMYVFEPGNSISISRSVYYSGAWHGKYGECRAGEWERCKSVFSEASKDHLSNIPSFCSYDSIEQAVKDTPFSWSGYESYLYADMVKFFDLYAKYPCVEYLTKLGFTSLVQDKLNGERTYSAINWRGKNLFKVLKITKKELNEIKSQKINLDFLSLKIFQIGKKDGSNLSIVEAHKMALSYSYYFRELEKTLAHINSSLRKANNYLNKQHEKDSRNYYSVQSALTAWRDYVADCITLEMDLNDEQVLYPRNLHNAHQNTIKQIKVKADEKLNEEIRKRLKSLEKYRFEYQGLIIRPVISTNELIAEGKALHHCVGTYADRYAKGETNIFVIRNTSSLDKPFYTVEIRKNKIFQVRGKNNCSSDESVSSFIEAYKREKLNKKKGKNEARIRVPA